MLRQTILDIINGPNAPVIGELRPSHDNVHHYYNRIVNAVTEARPTGPTPAYVRELEAELLAMKAELVALASKADELVMELTGVDRPEDDPLVDTLPASISMAVYELMELAHSALAANEAQS